MARKRLPTKLHIVRGTAQPCRINKLEPKAPPEPPRAPEWLSKRATEIFGMLTGRLQGMGLASVAYTEMQALAAIRLEEVELRQADIDANGAVYAKVELIEVPDPERPGSTVTKAQKIWKANPAVAMRDAAARHAQSILSGEFGLSPSGKTKVEGIR